MCVYSALDFILPKTQYSSLAFKDERQTKQVLQKIKKKSGLIDTDSFLKLVIKMFPLFLTVHLVGIIVLLFTVSD